MRQLAIQGLIYLVQNEIQQIEPGDECRRQVDVLSDGGIAVVVRPYRVRRG